MTIQDILNDKTFNNSHISKEVFGNARIISDKINNNRGKSWLPGDFDLIKNYFEKKYKIICE